LEYVNFPKTWRKRNEDDFEKKLISSTKNLNDLLSLLKYDEVANINWDDIKVEKLDDES